MALSVEMVEQESKIWALLPVRGVTFSRSSQRPCRVSQSRGSMMDARNRS